MMRQTKAMEKTGAQQSLSIYSVITEDLLKEWLDFIDVKETTSKNYMQALKKFASYCKEEGIGIPARSNIIEYREHIKNTLSAGTSQFYLMVLKLFIRWLSTKGLMLNVADHVKAVRVSPGHKRDILTYDQSDQVLSSLKDHSVKARRDRAMISLMLSCGLRRVEVARLNFSDIERRHDRWYLSVRGKGRDDKEIVQLPKETIAFIVSYLQLRGKFHRNDPLFISVSRRNYGGRMNVDSISRVCKEAFRAVGLDDRKLTCHSCRHTFATRALLNGEDIANVSMVLRHRSISTTMIYRHDITRETNHAEESVARSTLDRLLRCEQMDATQASAELKAMLAEVTG